MNNREKKSFTLQMLDLTNVDEKAFFHTFNEIVSRATSTIQDTEYELLEDINKVSARLYYFMQNEFATINT